ncbi:MAG: hypothetical protein AMJ56_20460 [Anaerolineae bacterium SG8_19]|nr:MAG: hypothetical protein AMJ56_20460 [Anaerolineae bacterium SG8_19]
MPFIDDLNPVHISPQQQGLMRVVHGNRIAISGKSHQREMVRLDWYGLAAGEGNVGQGQKMLSFHCQPLTDGFFSSFQLPLPLSPAFFSQVVIECFPGRKFLGRNEPVAATLPAGEVTSLILLWNKPYRCKPNFPKDF